MTTSSIRQLLLGACVATAMLPGAAIAQSTADWPARPVTIIVPLAPGAAVDIETRLYAQKLQQNMGGKSFLVDYKPGAGTTIGLGYVAKSAPDGYTLLSLTASSTIATIAFPELSFDPIKVLAPVSLMTYRPTLFLVNARTPWKTVKEFLAYAKANPGKINVGTSGAGGLGELSFYSFSGQTGIQLTVVHYKGAGPSNLALISGEIDMVWGGFASSTPHIRAGKARPIAIAAPDRSKVMSDLPTVSEAGVPGFSYIQWIGIAAPIATPASLIARMNAELVKVARDPDVLKRLEDDGTVAIGSTPERFRQVYEEDSARWRKVIQDTGIKLAQ